MTGEVREMGGVRVLVCAGEGPPIEGERAATDLVGEAYVADAAVVAIPLPRLGPGFLDLATRQAGELLQKLINYHRRVAIVGDVSAAAAQSRPLADFVRESNRGRHVWFVDDLAELERRLSGQAQ
jgi:hypothetical protein